MKNNFLKLALAVLTVGVLGSCSKINERLDNLDKRVDGIENEKIATINGQIDGIKNSIADLGQIRSDISNLKQTAESHGQDIFDLQEADETLGNRIDNLEDYLKNVLPNYAEKEWVKATYSTLEQYDSTCTAIAEINAKIGELDTKLSKDIETCADSLTEWINTKFEGYYTAAKMDADLAKMRASIDSAKAAGKISDTKADSVARELTKTKTAVDSAKSHIRSEYKVAIKTAIDSSEGRLTKKIQDEITKVNGRIDVLADKVYNLGIAVTALERSVEALEQMIQSVTIVPAFSDGSVKIDNDSLYIDCIVSPSKAVANLVAGNVAVLVNRVKTKANTGVDTIKIIGGNVFERDADKGTISLRVSIKNKIPAADSTITVAVNVNNGISNFTTDFVPVTIPVSVSLNINSVCVPFAIEDRYITLVATVKYATDISVTWLGTNHGVATVDNQGKVTIKANEVGKDTIVVKTVEGNATDTCFVIALPDGALAGEFSVSNTKKVHFSQGNLWHGKVGVATESTFNFEDKQYEYHTYVSSSNTWGLFGWSTSNDGTKTDDNYGMKTSNSLSDYPGNFYDWGKAVGDGNTWRTLTVEEWDYLFRRSGKYKYGVSVCNKKNCVVLLPDNWKWDENTVGTGWQTSYDESTDVKWSAMEAAGAVCLPAAGKRVMSYFYDTDQGFYWSSSGDRNNARFLWFSSSAVSATDNLSACYQGRSVRLVTECQNRPSAE